MRTIPGDCVTCDSRMREICVNSQCIKPPISLCSPGSSARVKWTGGHSNGAHLMMIAIGQLIGQLVIKLRSLYIKFRKAIASSCTESSLCVMFGQSLL